jgi:hypothetical protein
MRFSFPQESGENVILLYPGGPADCVISDGDPELGKIAWQCLRTSC